MDGDVVLIGSDNTKRISWPLGKITEVIPEKDGNIKTCKTKNCKG